MTRLDHPRAHLRLRGAEVLRPRPLTLVRTTKCMRCDTGRVNEAHHHLCPANVDHRGMLPVARATPVEAVIAPVYAKLLWSACGPSPILQCLALASFDATYRRLPSGYLFWVGGTPSKSTGWTPTGTVTDVITRGAYAYRPDREGA